MYDKTKFADVTFAVESAPESVADKVFAISGVNAVTGRLIIDTGYLLPNDKPIRSRLIGLPDDMRPKVDDLWIEDGRYFKEGEKGVAIVDSHFAKYYKLEIGDKVTPIIQGEKTSLEIIAIATSPEYIIVSPGDPQSIMSTAESFAVLFVPLPYLQTVYNLPDSVNDFAVLIDEKKSTTSTTSSFDNTETTEVDTNETNPIIDDIEEVLKPYTLKSTTLQKDQASNEALQLDLDSYEALAKSVPLIMLLIAAISIFMTLGRTVTAQQPQVGLMKAIGYGNGAIFAHYMLLALFIGLIGAILGVALGLLTSGFITSIYARELGVPTISISFYPDLIIFGVLLSLGSTILGGIFPARSATKRLPAEAMKYDPAAVSIAGRKSIFERIFNTGLWGRLTIRNVFRVPRRTFSNVLGIIFAFVLVLMSWSWIDSLENMLDKGFNQIAQWDIQATFQTEQDETTTSKVAGWDDVIDAEPAFLVPAVVKAVEPDSHAEEKEIDISLTAFDPKQKMIKLDLIKTKYADMKVEDALAKNRLILTPIAAQKLLLDVGDQVDVSTYLGTYRLELIAIADQVNDGQGYIGTETLSNAETASNPQYASVGTETLSDATIVTDTQTVSNAQVAGLFNILYLTTDPDQANYIKEDLYKLPNVASVQSLEEARATYNLLLGLFYAFVGVMLVFSLGMAFALLYNGITITITERQREFATMRSIGTSEYRIAWQLIVENAIIWLLAILPGWVLGYLIAVNIGSTLSTEWFNFRVTIDPRTYVWSSLLILATMIVAGIPAFRRLRNVDLASGTKGAV
jgi:putative ABC transport system permease protein